MTLEEKRVIKSMESEAKRLGRFERIYPTQNSKKYRNFFDEDRPLNQIAIDHLNGKLKNLAQTARNRVLKPKIPRKQVVAHLSDHRR